jgi:adenylate cyclase, class 2
MALNLELKISTASHEYLIEKIIKNGGKSLDTLLQKDTYYKFEKGLLKLRRQNGDYQLVKYNRNEKEEERWSDYSLLFLTGENVEEYLSELFDIETIVEKKRQLFIYKNTRIHLDEVENLGKFLELETVVKEISKEDAKTEFNEVVEFLGLNVAEQIRKSYRDLLIEK